MIENRDFLGTWRRQCVLELASWDRVFQISENLHTLEPVPEVFSRHLSSCPDVPHNGANLVFLSLWVVIPWGIKRPFHRGHESDSLHISYSCYRP